jgi:hypothetical protein
MTTSRCGREHKFDRDKFNTFSINKSLFPSTHDTPATEIIPHSMPQQFKLNKSGGTQSNAKKE